MDQNVQNAQKDLKSIKTPCKTHNSEAMADIHETQTHERSKNASGGLEEFDFDQYDSILGDEYGRQSSGSTNTTTKSLHSPRSHKINNGSTRRGAPGYGSGVAAVKVDLVAVDPPTSGGAFYSGLDASLTAYLRQENSRLHEGLETQKTENQRLGALLAHYKERASELLVSQARLEEKTSTRDIQIACMASELEQAKIDRSRAEQAAYLEMINSKNEKAQWLKTEASLKKKMSELKQENDQHNNRVRAQTQAQAQVLSRSQEELLLIKQQMEVMTKEYSLRFEQVKDELHEVKQINQRLMDENDNFQLLLAEQTILKGASLEQDLKNIEATATGGATTGVTTGITTGITSGAPDFDISLNSLELSEPEPSTPSEPSNPITSDLQFELDALKNQNTALKLSLQRFVLRLLEFKEFEAPLHERTTVSTRSVSEFQTRMYRHEHRMASSPVPSLSHSPRSSSSSVCSPPESPVLTRNNAMITAASVLSPASAFFSLKTPNKASAWNSANFRAPNASPLSFQSSRSGSGHRNLSLGIDDICSHSVSSSRRTMSIASDSCLETSSCKSTGSIIGSEPDSDRLQRIMDAALSHNVRRPSIETQSQLRPLTLI